MRRPDASRSFLLRAVLLLPLALGLWHWAQIPVINAMCAAADAVWPSLFPHGLAWVEGSGSTDWTIHTGWPVLPSIQQRLVVKMEIIVVARLVAGFPLLFALCFATPGMRWCRLALGAALLAVISWLALTCYAWHALAISTGTQPSFVDDKMLPLPVTLGVAPYPAWQVYLSGYLMYLGILIIPFVTPLVLWAWLFRDFARRLVLGLRLQHARSARARS